MNITTSSRPARRAALAVGATLALGAAMAPGVMALDANGNDAFKLTEAPRLEEIKADQKLTAGEQLILSAVFTNASDQAMTHITARDALHPDASASCTPVSIALAPGEQGSCWVTYTVTDQDVDAGKIVTDVTLSATTATGGAKSTELGHITMKADGTVTGLPTPAQPSPTTTTTPTATTSPTTSPATSGPTTSPTNTSTITPPEPGDDPSPSNTNTQSPTSNPTSTSNPTNNPSTETGPLVVVDQPTLRDTGKGALYTIKVKNNSGKELRSLTIKDKNSNNVIGSCTNTFPGPGETAVCTLSYSDASYSDTKAFVVDPIITASGADGLILEPGEMKLGGSSTTSPTSTSTTTPTTPESTSTTATSTSNPTDLKTETSSTLTPASSKESAKKSASSSKSKSGENANTTVQPVKINSGVPADL